MKYSKQLVLALFLGHVSAEGATAPADYCKVTALEYDDKAACEADADGSKGAANTAVPDTITADYSKHHKCSKSNKNHLIAKCSATGYKNTYYAEDDDKCAKAEVTGDDIDAGSKNKIDFEFDKCVEYEGKGYKFTYKAYVPPPPADKTGDADYCKIKYVATFTDDKCFAGGKIETDTYGGALQKIQQKAFVCADVGKTAGKLFAKGTCAETGTDGKMTLKYYKDKKCEEDADAEALKELDGDWKTYHDNKMENVEFGKCTKGKEGSFAIFHDKTTTKTTEIIGAKTDKDYCKIVSIKEFTDAKCTKDGKDIKDMDKTIKGFVKLHKLLNREKGLCVKDGDNYLQGTCTATDSTVSAYSDEKCTVKLDSADKIKAAVKASSTYKSLEPYTDIKMDFCYKLEDKKYFVVSMDPSKTPEFNIPTGEKNDLESPEKAVVDPNTPSKPEEEHPKDYCLIDSITAFKDATCGTKDDSMTADKLKKLAAAWTKSAKEFKKCRKVDGENVYEKVVCNKEHMVATKYSDPACETKATLKDKSTVIETTLKWNTCVKSGDTKSFKFKVNEKSVETKDAKYMAAGASALLAVAASLY